jgi:flagellar biosynthetic protein FlhB
LYIALGFIFAMIDQVIVRAEFKKQMKMSRSELKREVKDREGEPRIKQKRKELHKEFSKQTGSLGDLPGSDVLIVNPQHFAVALRYDAETMDAPIVSAKGRNRFALMLKTKAARLGIPILANPPLARALYRTSDPGQPIPPQHFKSVADSYVVALRLKSQDPSLQKETD